MKKLIYVFLLFVFVVNTKSQVINTEEELTKYLNQKENIFEEISNLMGIATWNIYSGEATSDTKT
ncbi:MAG TPA: hypothetical protein PL041_15150, partial [Melioribacteraceae bacterium]|nr:hypothetical protein [Melioribacteraceae bacterium]